VLSAGGAGPVFRLPSMGLGFQPGHLDRGQAGQLPRTCPAVPNSLSLRACPRALDVQPMPSLLGFFHKNIQSKSRFGGCRFVPDGNGRLAPGRSQRHFRLDKAYKGCVSIIQRRNCPSTPLPPGKTGFFSLPLHGEVELILVIAGQWGWRELNHNSPSPPPMTL
jgi:hypothetical protein